MTRNVLDDGGQNEGEIAKIRLHRQKRSANNVDMKEQATLVKQSRT